jgi:hypothetical protein
MEGSVGARIFFVWSEENFAPIRIVLGRRDQKLEKLSFRAKTRQKRKRIFLVNPEYDFRINPPIRWSFLNAVGSSRETSVSSVQISVGWAKNFFLKSLPQNCPKTARPTTGTLWT